MSTYFGNLEAAAEKGQLGAVLYFLSPLNITYDWQQDFVKGFFKHCQKKGNREFSHYVLHHSDLFFKYTARTCAQVQSWKAQCFVTAFLTDLRVNRGSFLEEKTEMERFQTLSLTQAHVDELYVASAKLANYGLMDHMLAHSSWPKPRVKSENFALQVELNANDYGRVKWMLTAKPGKKPEQKILDGRVAKDASEGNWHYVDRILAEIYSAEPVIAPQELTDTLYVYAAAYANEKYLALLTSKSWVHRPTPKARDSAFVHTCMNNHMGVMESIAIESTISPAAFDQGLTETVKYRHQKTFDKLLDDYVDQLSEPGMRAALEQAGKPSQKKVAWNDFSIENSFLENHYQKRLKEKLGIEHSDFFTSLIRKYSTFEPIKFDLTLNTLILKDTGGDGDAASAPTVPTVSDGDASIASLA